METLEDKMVYVAVGPDEQDGLVTLGWALQKWAPHSISIVILHPPITNHFVYTPFGKMPASFINDDKVENLKKCEEGKADKTLSKYIAFCGKVKVQVLKMEKFDEPIHKMIVDLISSLKITNLVLSITFMKSPSWKSRSALSGSFYIHRNKPDYCELILICGGKPLLLREENNEGLMEDDRGIVVAKFGGRNSFRERLGKMFPMIVNEKRSPVSSSTSNDSPNDQWEKYAEEIEHYFEMLSVSNSDDQGNFGVENDRYWSSLMEQDMPENLNGAARIEAVEMKMRRVEEAIELKRKEGMANRERHDKAEWAISVCTNRTDELESRIKEEFAKRISLKNDLHNAKDEISEIQTEIDEQRAKLNSILEIQRELSNRLRFSSLARTNAEAQLERSATRRAQIVREIEDQRKQRDVFHRRIEFCREKDAIGMVERMGDLEFGDRQFSAEEIRAATDRFSERLRLKSAGEWTDVYRGRIKNTTVAIKVYGSEGRMSTQAFQAKVNLLSNFRHPHLVAMIGFCPEPKSIVFEYMHNGCLRDSLFSSSHTTSAGKKRRRLNWHTRIHIAAQVGSALGFLHRSQPRPVAHGSLNPSKILLDRNNFARIHGLGGNCCRDEPDIRSDVRAFGSLVLQLLTGRNWVGLVEVEMLADGLGLAGVLDESAGEWPVELAGELARIALRCSSGDGGLHDAVREIMEVRKKADNLTVSGEYELEIEEEGGLDEEVLNCVPSLFLCPIFQVVMKNPHIAEDGFSYELEAIEKWLRTGNQTSPMTNLKLNHKLLIPNHTLRSLIQDWHHRRSIPLI